MDDLIVTIVPILLGDGLPLFAGVTRRHPLELVSHARMSPGMLQTRFRPSG